jgi:16S rRNA C967 or C1407 C5-methylase (RsmB/RsmF family)
MEGSCCTQWHLGLHSLDQPANQIFAFFVRLVSFRCFLQLHSIMTKTTRSFGSAAEQPFHKHFVAIYGEERWWDSLYPALMRQTRYCALVNKYTSLEKFWETMADAQILPDDVQKVELPLSESPSGAPETDPGLLCYAHPSMPLDLAKEQPTTKAFPGPIASSGSAVLMTHWNLDAASVLVAHLLQVQSGDKVLDICAAPGGKSIALAQRVWSGIHLNSQSDPSASGGLLVSNEVDTKRQKRLADNLRAYLPEQLIQNGMVRCTKVDASLESAGLNALRVSGGYDRVLVDAPCSSERHVVHADVANKKSAEIASWRAGTSKRLAKTQVDILMSALKLAKIGGVLIYATCSIEPQENDGVIEKMIALVEKERKKGATWHVALGFDDTSGRLDSLLQQWAEKTKYGWIVLPDHTSGGQWGPLFFCRVTKTG